MMDVANMLSEHTNKFEARMSETTEKLETHIKELEKEINELKSP
jgi:archaellum component FlaC